MSGPAHPPAYRLPLTAHRLLETTCSATTGLASTRPERPARSPCCSTAVLFDLLALRHSTRQSFRQVGFWTLLARRGRWRGSGAFGSPGRGAHLATATRSTGSWRLTRQLGLITLGIFGVLTLWRIVRERRMGPRRARARPAPLTRRRRGAVRHRGVRRQAGVRACGGDSHHGAAGGAAGASQRTITMTAGADDHAPPADSSMAPTPPPPRGSSRNSTPLALRPAPAARALIVGTALARSFVLRGGWLPAQYDPPLVHPDAGGAGERDPPVRYRRPPAGSPRP